MEPMEECSDCGSTGHDTGSDTCPGPGEQDQLEDPNQRDWDEVESTDDGFDNCFF